MTSKPEVQIDWETAPAGTTHVNPKVGPCAWRKFEDGQWHQWWAREWITIPRDHSPEYIARPVFWNGEGLPPVGTVCEWSDADGASWHKVEVRYLSKHTALLHFPGDGDGDTEGAFSPSCCEFRPLRTPEQIAAEERNKAIDEMVYGAIGADRNGSNTTAFVICGLLYAAGYRKAEGGAQ